MNTSIMNKRLVTWLLLALSLLALAACTASGTTAVQSGQPETDAGSQITVIGRGEAFGQPDQAQAQVGVEIFAPTVAEATAENEAIIQRIMVALEAMQIAPEDIQTTNYSLWAEQRYSEEGPQGISGYRVNNMVSVTIRDIDQVSDVLAAVTEAGANAIHGITFSVDDPAELEQEARAAAMDDARARAGSLAELSDLELAEVAVVSEVLSQTPFPPMGMGGAMAVEEAAAGPGISPGQLSYAVQVQVTFSAR